MARPVGVWIAQAYLVLLLALAVVVLVAPLPLASAILTVPFRSPTGVLVVKSFVLTIAVFLAASTVLLWRLKRWAVATTGVVAALTATGFYLSAGPTVVTPLSVYAYAFVDPLGVNVIAPFYLLGTVAVFVYTAWLWRRGALK
jgi:hypothetical protein